MPTKPIPKDFENIYKRNTCQKCNKAISKKRLENCKERRFWPVCEECEKIIIPLWKKASEMLAKGQASWIK